MLKRRPVRDAMEKERSLMREDDLLGVQTDGEQFILQIVRKYILSFRDSMDFP